MAYPKEFHNPALEKYLLAEEHCRHGESLYWMGDPTGAATAFQESLAIEPRFAIAHSNLGVLRFQEGDLPQALEHLTQALAINPANRKAVLNLGIVLRELQQFDRAEEVLVFYLDSHPEDELVQEGLSNLRRARAEGVRA